MRDGGRRSRDKKEARHGSAHWKGLKPSARVVQGPAPAKGDVVKPVRWAVRLEINPSHWTDPPSSVGQTVREDAVFS